MGGHRFDELTRMAAGMSRRRALRLLGGGLAAALLAALGRGDRAAAERIVSGCINYGETGGPPVITGDPGGTLVFQQPCPACAHIEGAFCTAWVNPVNKLTCRCFRP